MNSEDSGESAHLYILTLVFATIPAQVRCSKLLCCHIYQCDGIHHAYESKSNRYYIGRLQFSMSGPYRLNLSRVFGRACAPEHSLLASCMLAHVLPLRSNQQVLILHY